MTVEYVVCFQAPVKLYQLGGQMISLRFRTFIPIILVGSSFRFQKLMLLFQEIEKGKKKGG